MHTRTHAQIASDLKNFLADSYPNIAVRVETFGPDPTRTAIYFTEEKFSLIYPTQRFHYLSHLIPAEYQDLHLKDTFWFELAPGEDPDALVYPDDDLVRDITPDVMKCLHGSRFFHALDDRMCPVDPSVPRASCWGDYRVSKSILPGLGFPEAKHFDVFHVLMAQGGFCDCEILLNVVSESRLKTEYWKAREAGRSCTSPSHTPAV